MGKEVWLAAGAFVVGTALALYSREKRPLSHSEAQRRYSEYKRDYRIGKIKPSVPLQNR